MAKRKETKKSVRVHDRLLDALSNVNRPGTFCTSGDRPVTMPGLVVTGLGAVRLPLGKTQARKLIKLCRQAPYGKGTKTVVDTEVRRVWELDPDQFELSNSKWNDLIASLVEEVQTALGLEGRHLTAQLFKLLIYEQGGFFLPHRDGEKLDRMVATLVVALPSEHEGGELIIYHDGAQHEIFFAGAASGHELGYAAFYADCQHEVRPVRSGYRLCLTYNLTLAKSRGKNGIPAPSYTSTAAALGKLLNDWRHRPEVPKLAVTLEHRYSQEGLSMDKLKGIDRARAEVMFDAADQADCVAHLALVTLWQSGAAEGGYDEYGYGRRRGYYWSDDEDDDQDEEGETGSKYEMGEIYDHSLSANHWSDRQGKKVALGEIRLDENEIVSPEALDESDPNREDFEGYTGNAGMTLERWYHRAAIVIWPRTEHFQVLCGAGTDAAIGGLEPMVNRLKRASKAQREEQRRICLSFATAIIDTWKPDHRGHAWKEADRVDRNVFPRLLCVLDDTSLVRQFISRVMHVDSAVQLDKSFTAFCKKHGWAGFQEELSQVIEGTTDASITRNAQLLRMLCVERDKNAERLELCRRLCETFANAVKACDARHDGDQWHYGRIDRSALLVSTVTAMLAVGAEAPLSALIEHALACDKYDLTDAHLAAIFVLESRIAKSPGSSAAISRWLAACRRELVRRTAKAPRKPTDYRRDHKLSCTCADCRALSEFLDDPRRREGRFPLAKTRRQHLHNIIDRNRCDCTHVTHRQGRPFALVCTKTTASYEAACKIYQRDVENLSRLVALEKRTN